MNTQNQEDITKLKKLTINIGLRPIARSLGIKYYSLYTKKELIEEIIRIKNGGNVKDTILKFECEHKKQKYICILCHGRRICEHNKQIQTCKICN